MEQDAYEIETFSEQIAAATKITVDEFLSFLESKGLDTMPCELCENKEWAVSSVGRTPDIIMKKIVGVSSDGFVVRSSRAFYYCFCMDCGNTKEFLSDLVLKKIKPESEEGQRFDQKFGVSKERTKK